MLRNLIRAGQWDDLLEERWVLPVAVFVVTSVIVTWWLYGHADFWTFITERR